MKRRKREQEIASVVFNTDSYSVSRSRSNGIHLSFWLSLWIGDNSQTGIAQGPENRVKPWIKGKNGGEVQNERHTKYFSIMFQGSIKLTKYSIWRWDTVGVFIMFIFIYAFPRHSSPLKIYLALATHSMIASFLPIVTLVFLGGMMIDGAMGSAGPPTSIMHKEIHTGRQKNVKKSIHYTQTLD